MGACLGVFLLDSLFVKSAVVYSEHDVFSVLCLEKVQHIAMGTITVLSRPLVTFKHISAGY